MPRGDVEPNPQPTLTPFDVTSLVVGAVVGGGIYVVASLGAGLLGPAMLVAWAIAGAMAGLIALCFSQCAAIVPKTGGPYAYAREAFGYFPGFLVGWTLYLSKLFTISIFPVAFVGYLEFFIPNLGWWEETLARAALIAFVTGTNYFGSRISGKINDALAIAKLGPLVLLALLGLIFVSFEPARAVANLVPFAPLGWSSLGQAVIVIYWAYAGFELAALPAAEVVDARRVLPLAIARGMAIVAIFYLLVNTIVVLSMPSNQLAGTSSPLAEALQTIMFSLSLPLWPLAYAIMALGALLSISSSDESTTIGTSRLCYAMAADGYLPHFLARLHPKHRSPDLALIFQGVFALAASSLGDLTTLIELSVFFLSISYLSTVLATMRLVHRSPDRRLPFAGSRPVLALALASSVYLMSQSAVWVLFVGAMLVGAGVMIYLCFAPKSELVEVQKTIEMEERRLAELEHTLLGVPVHALRRTWDRFRGKGQSH